MVEPISGIIYAIIKAVPAVRDIFLKVQQMKIDEECRAIDVFYIKKQEKTALLLLKIEEAKTHEEKLILFSAYNDISGMQDS
jgi:hypothetical protein